jgi:hypothetical protein
MPFRRFDYDGNVERFGEEEQAPLDSVFDIAASTVGKRSQRHCRQSP